MASSSTFLLDTSVLTTNDVIGKFYNVSYGIAFIIFLTLFVAEIFQEQVNSIGNKEPNYIEIFKRAIIIFCGLLAFKYIFFRIVGLCELISNALFDQWQMTYFYDGLVKYKEANPVRFNLSLMSGRVGVVDIIIALLLPITLIIEQVILIMRSCLLSVLYIIGPLALVAGLWKSTRTFMISWFKSLFQISFWIIVFRAIEASFVGSGVNVFLQVDGTTANAVPIKIFLVCLVFIGLLCMSLAITMKLCSGENLGTVGSAAIGVVGAFATRTGILNSAKTLVSKTGKSASGIVGRLKNKGNGGTINKSKPRR